MLPPPSLHGRDSSNAMEPKLRATLKIGEQDPSSGEIRAVFTLTNEGDADVYVLTAQTPLEGLCSDFLDVTCEGLRVPYDGPMIKRGAPTEEQYLRISPGEVVREEFELTSAYSIRSGDFEVRFKGCIPDAGTRVEIRERVRELADEWHPVYVSIEPIRFTIPPGTRMRSTRGETARGSPAPEHDDEIP